MPKRGSSPRLRLESIHRLRIRGQVPPQHFKHDWYCRTSILREIHFAHPADADERLDLVVPDSLTLRECAGLTFEQIRGEARWGSIEESAHGFVDVEK